MRGIVLLAVVLGTAAPVAADGPEVAVVVAGEADEAVAAQLGEVLERAPVRRSVASTGDGRALIRAAAGFPEPYLIALDVAGGMVRVVRGSDGTLVARSFDPAAGRAAPYAVALLAAELLELAREAPLRLARLEAEPHRAEDVPPGTAPLRLELGLSAGGLFHASVGGSAAVLAPAVATELLAGFGRSGLRLGLGIEGALLGGFSRRIESQGALVRYRRTDVALRAIVAQRDGPITLMASLDLALAWIGVQAELDAGPVPDHRRTEIAGGATVAARLRLEGGLFLQIALGARWSPSPVRYLVRGTLAVEETEAQIRSSLVAGWEFR